MADDKVIIDIDVDNDGALKATQDLTSAIVDQTDAIKATNDETKKLEKQNKDFAKQNKELELQIKKGTKTAEEGNKQITSNSKAIETNSAKIKQNKVEVIGQKDDLKKLNVERKQAIKTLEANANSIEALRARNVVLRKEQVKVNLSTEEGQKALKEINAELNKNNATIKDNSDELSKQKQSVGGYEEAINNALGPLEKMFPAVGKITEVIKTSAIGFKQAKDESKGFSGSLKTTDGQLKRTSIGFGNAQDSVEQFNTTTSQSKAALKDTATGMKSAESGTKGFITGMKGAIKASLAFIATPLGIILAAIAVVVGIVVKAMSKMQPVLDKVNQLTAGLGGSLDAVLGIFVSIGKFIKETFINSFLRLEKGILKVRIALNKFTGDAEEVEKLEKDLDKVNKDLAESNIKVADSFDAVGDSITNVGKAFDASGLIEKQRQLAEITEIANIAAIAALQKQADLLSSIADDATKSFAIRRKAALDLAKVQTDIFEKQLVVNKLREAALISEAAERKKNGASNRDEDRKLAESTAARIQTETSLQNFKRENEKRLSELNIEELERDLDFEIDIIDKRLQAIRGQAGQEFLTIEERLKATQDFTSKFDESVKRQVDILQNFTDKKIDLDDLQNTSDISVLTQKVRNLGLSEKIEGRLLEVLRDRIDALFDLNETEKVLIAQSNALEEKRVETVQKTSDLELQIRRDAQLKALEGTSVFFDKQQQFAEEDFDTTEANLEKALKNQEITKEAFALKSLENQKKFNDETLAISKDRVSSSKDVDQEDFAAKRQLEDEAFEAKVEALDLELLTEEEHKLALQELEADHNEKMLDIFNNQVEAIADATQGAADTASSLLTSVLKVAQNNLDKAHTKENKALKDKFDKGLLTQEQFDKAKLDLDKKQAKEQHKIDVAKFKADQAKNIVDILINTAVGVSKAIAQANIPLSITLGVLGLAQVAAVATQPPPPAPTFAEGGMVIKGKSHAQGGENIHVGGKLVGNMQGNEGLFVTKREATADALSYMNESHGGRAFSTKQHSAFFQEGGAVIAPAAETPGVPLEDLQAAFSGMTIEVQVVDIQAGLQGNADSLQATVV